MKANRRHFLAGLGAGALTLPFLRRADAQVAPRRLILFFTPHGTLHSDDFWTGGSNDPWSSPQLSQLDAFADDLLLVRGLQLYGERGGGPHTRAAPLLFTGSEQLPGDKAKHGGGDDNLDWGGNATASVDHVVAQHFQSSGSGFAYDRLYFGIHCGGNGLRGRVSFSGPDSPSTPIQDAQAAFDHVFADAELGEAEQQWRRVRGRSVLDAVAKDLKGLESRLAEPERVKVQRHLDAVRTIEQQLANTHVCAPPTLGPSEVEPGVQSDGTSTYHRLQDTLHQQIQVMTEAMACDLTRVGVLQVGRPENDNSLYFPADERHHLTSHMTNATADAYLTRVRKMYSLRFADLLRALKSIPEGGGSMLDNTMIIWGTDVAIGSNHSFHNMPFVVAGGRNFIDTGRVLDVPRHQDLDAVHQRLLVAALHGMGLTHLDTFGDNDTGGSGNSNQNVGTGPLAGVLSS